MINKISQIEYDKKKVEEIYEEVKSIPMSFEEYEEQKLFSPSQVKRIIAFMINRNSPQSKDKGGLKSHLALARNSADTKRREGRCQKTLKK